MRIKELHLRNIASIEKADIDFTKDLNDRITGEPASVFLICGDTGSGKSVLLDAISMALYRKTPRTEDVSNPMRNEFKNKSGENIRVNSISQYTRDGISVKDDCYSEVVFEGNDGMEYRARLELGVYLSNTDATGERRVLHRKPKWTLSSSHAEYSGVAAEEVILSATGLSFEQFSRMALLAQGRFEAFLTGDKVSREIILEQLTDTGKFSNYGMAISRIFKRMSDEKKMLETLLSERSARNISSQDAEKLMEEKAQAEKQLEELSSRRKTLLEKKAGVSACTKASEEMQEAKAKEAEVLKHMESAEFKALEKFLSDWDLSNRQRQLSESVKQSRMTLAVLQEDEEKLKKEFAGLNAGFSLRLDALEKKQIEAGSRSAWLDSEKRNENLYSQAGEICERIRQWKETDEAIISISSELDKALVKAGTLDGSLRERKAVFEKAVSEEEEIQKKAEAFSALIAEERPEETEEKIKTLAEKIFILGNLKSRVERYIADAEEAAGLSEKIDSLKVRQEDLAALLSGIVLRREKAAAEADKAASRFSAMSASLDDILRGLRKQLLESGSDICPLCGQSIKELHVEDDFKRWLSPLEIEKKEKYAVLERLSAEENRLRSSLAAVKGEVCAMSETLESSSKSLKETCDAIIADMVKEGLYSMGESSDKWVDSICKKMEENENLQEELKLKQSRIKELQRRKDEIFKTKLEAQNMRFAAERQVIEAEKTLQSNSALIAEFRRHIEENVSKKESLAESVSKTLSAQYPEWKTDSEGVRTVLKAAAETYKIKKEELSRFNAEIALESAAIEEIMTVKETVAKQHPEWRNLLPERLSGYSANTRQAWNSLLSSSSAVSSGKASCIDTINRAEKELEAFFRENGISAEDLSRLISNSGKIPEIRRRVEESRSELRTYRHQIIKARDEMDSEMKKMGISDIGQLPDMKTIEEEMTETDRIKDALVAKVASADSQIKAYFSERDALQKQRKELEAKTAVYLKWEILDKYFGGTRFRTLVQSHILKPLLNNANLYLKRITDRYTLTCSGENEQLSIFVHDHYLQQLRSSTVLSGGEKFIISLALSLALSSLNRPDMNVNILFIDEGFGTLDEKSLDSVMETLEKLREIAGESNRRVGIISHREELEERIPVQIRVKPEGAGRSKVEINSR